MKKSSVTIRDVARAAGVSPGTASRALKNNPLVREETRLHVQKIARELNYIPNIMAQRLSLGKTLSIAVLAPFFTRPAFSARLQGLMEALEGTSYDLIVHNIDNPEKRTVSIKNLLTPQRVDGAVLISLPLDQDLQAIIAQAPIPLVLIDIPNCEHLPVSQVRVDDIFGGYQATHYLIRLGHKKIAFIGDIPDPRFQFTSSKYRLEGYRRALYEAGIPFNEAYIAYAPILRQAARQKALQLLQKNDRPTAIFAASDTHALGVLEAARELELKVPQDLSVIGYDNLEIADHIGLTTIDQQLVESGRQGGRILLQELQAPHASVLQKTLETHVVVRASTAQPAITG